jgi:hypothetical protein
MFFLCCSFTVSKPPKVSYVSAFGNTRHPEIAYWFFSKDVVADDNYLAEIDYLAAKSKFDLLFLTARNGLNFYDFATMHPVFKKVVDEAHKNGLKIGLQLWENRAPVAIEHTERMIVENECLLDVNGLGQLIAKARHVRSGVQLIKSDLFKVYAFKKSDEGYYLPGTLKDITASCKSESPDKETVIVHINSSAYMNGYTALVMTQHYYNYCSTHDAEASNRFIEALQAYADIPFDGIGLDEYTNLRVATKWELEKAKETFRESPYSLAMAKQFETKYGYALDRALFDMRYAPQGKPEIRAKAINYFMENMRSGTLQVEQAVYTNAKKIFGKTEFAGLHDTHHNSLDGDEIWQTGLNWWNIPREYGQTDETTPTPTQLGIAQTYPQNVLFNMYYNKSLDNITEKALTDLRYGIRTHYHALNDVQGWGVSMDKPETLDQVNPVENCSRLLNQFNPALPQTKLLVVFGMEALANWYPNYSQRGMCDINDKLFIEEKAKAIWDAGYRDALVPADLILDGRLKLDNEGKPVINGHQYDAIVFLYPQYAHQQTLKFLEEYVSKGGKLMTEGDATNDFDGNNIESRWGAIRSRATVNGFDISQLAKLNIKRDAVDGGSLNSDGSYVFTDIGSLRTATPAKFSFKKNNDLYTGQYIGIAAVSVNDNGELLKLSAGGFKELRKNGKLIFSLDRPADVFADLGSNPQITIADVTKSIKAHFGDLQ